MFWRHHLSAVGFVEHHLHDPSEVDSTKHLAKGHGYTFLCNHYVDPKSGVGLLWDNKWSLVATFSVHPRLLVVVLCHSNQLNVAFVVGHFCNNPHRRMPQWKALGHVVDSFDDLPIIFLVDHILSHLDSTHVNVWSQNELSAMQAEREVLGALGVLDAWAHQFPKREVPGHTSAILLRAVADAAAEEVSRRIDRKSVSPNLLCYGTSMFTTPAGFTDHSAVVHRFVGLGLARR